MFAEIPEKVSVSGQRHNGDVWPEYGDRCEMNLFYREYSFAEGWMGDGFLVIWSRREIYGQQPSIRESYPDKYHFFGCDDCGSQFGFFENDGFMTYVCGPDIGSENELRVLGGWDEFVKRVSHCDYV